MMSFATYIRWMLARRRVKQFGRPRRIGRNVAIGSGACIGRRVTLGDGVTIQGDVQIADDVVVESGVRLYGAIHVGAGSQIGGPTYIGTGPYGYVSIGADVLVNSFSALGAMSRLTIGNHCIFAPHLQITDSEHGFEFGQLVKHAPINSEPVSIGDDVWLGSHVVVLKGSQIGAHAVIGAHSLVNSSIPDNAVAFGIPARIRKMRGGAEG